MKRGPAKRRGPIPEMLGMPLTPREKEVVQLVCEGWSHKQIAPQLGISHRTVDIIRAHVVKKIGTRSAPALGVWAIRNGILVDSVRC